MREFMRDLYIPRRLACNAARILRDRGSVHRPSSEIRSLRTTLRDFVLQQDCAHRPSFFFEFRKAGEERAQQRKVDARSRLSFGSYERQHPGFTRLPS